LKRRCRKTRHICKKNAENRTTGERSVVLDSLQERVEQGRRGGGNKWKEKEIKSSSRKRLLLVAGTCRNWALSNNREWH